MAVAALAGAAIAWLGCRFSIEGVYSRSPDHRFAEFPRIAFDHFGAAGGAGGFFLPYQAERLGQCGTCAAGRCCSITSPWRSRLPGDPHGLAQGARVGYQWRAVREDQQAARALASTSWPPKIKSRDHLLGDDAVGRRFYAFYYNSLFPAPGARHRRSIELILAPIVAGSDRIRPGVGAFILTPLGETAHHRDGKARRQCAGRQGAVLRLTLMAIVVVRPDGVWPWLAPRLPARRSQATERLQPERHHDGAVVVEAVSKQLSRPAGARCGDFEVAPGELFAIIGPMGPQDHSVQYDRRRDGAR